MPITIDGTGTISGVSASGITTAQTVSATNITTGTLPKAQLPTGSTLQVVNAASGAVATGSTAIPMDNSIPQITEGTEFLTVTITPTSATSKLVIIGQMYITTNTTTSIVVALFQDSTANALTASAFYEPTSTGQMVIPFNFYMTAGTTSATTFRIRCGTSGGNTVTFNGNGGTRDFGGVACSSVTVMEISA